MTADADDTTVEVELHGVAHGGDAVGRLPDGKTVFVRGGIPGERVRVEVTEHRRKLARGHVTAVLDASPDRVTPPCPYVPACGGCDLQHVAPDAQRRLKTRIVREQLERIGGLHDPPVDDTRPVGPDTRYRTSARLHADTDGRLGFHGARSHEVVAVDDCLVLDALPQALREQVGDATGAAEVTVRGFADTGAAAVVLTAGPGGLELPEGEFDLALEQPDGSLLPLRGDAVLTATVGDFTYRLDAGCFFQVNLDGAGALVEQTLAAAGPLADRTCWDLYAGVGLLTLPLAAAGARVTAVEAHARAAEWARHNLDAAGLDGEVVPGRAEPFVRDHADGAPPDVVVVDPPRRGAGRAVVEPLTALGPERVVYVACDPAALARDVGALVAGGYTLDTVVPLDLFPMTHHIEAVATLSAGAG